MHDASQTSQSLSSEAAASINPAAVKTGWWWDIRRTVWLALPIIAGNLAGMGMNFVDTVMAGRLGAVSLGAISIGGAVWSGIFLFAMGLLMATPPAVSHLDGADQPKEAGAVARQAMWVALAMALVMWFLLRNSGWLLELVNVDAAITPIALDYLQAISWGAPGICLLLVARYFSEGIGLTGPTMYIGLIGVLLNVPLNYIFMYGKLGFPELGAVGCGWATAIIYCGQLLSMLLWIAGRPAYRRYGFFASWDWPQWSQIKSLLSVGLPIGGMIFCEGCLFVGAALLIGSLGAIPIAAHQIAINFSALCFMVPLGLAGAITVRVGNAIGRGQSDAARQAGWAGISITLFTQSVAAALMFFTPEWVVSWYTNDTAVAQLAVSLLFLAAIFQFPDGIQAAAAGTLRGYKDTRIPMLISIIAYWLFGLVIGYWLTFTMGWGAPGMWTGMIGGLGTAAILLTVRFIIIGRRH